MRRALSKGLKFKRGDSQVAATLLPENLFHLAQQLAAYRLVLQRRRALQFLQDLTLALGELLRRVYFELNVEIAPPVTIEDRHSLVFHFEGRSRLCALRDSQRMLAF